MKALDRNAHIAVTRPNWSRPFGVEYSFKTGIITSWDGTEQREAHRQTARVVLKFSTALTRPGLIRVQGDLAEGQERPTLVRAEWRSVKLASDHVSGGTDIVVEEVPVWLNDEIDVILTTDTHEDHFTVFSVAGTTITLGAATQRDYPAGTKLHLAYWTRHQDKVEFRAATSMVWEGNMRFDVVPGTAAEVYKASSGYAFGCREILLPRPNWRDKPRISFTQERDVFDPGMGLIDVNARHLADPQITRFTFTGKTAEEAEGLIEFFQRMKGRRGSFWMPTWQRDVLPSATAIAGNNKFQVDGQDFRDAFLDDPIYNTMIAFWDDGSFQVNRVTNIAGTTESEVEFKYDWINPITEDTRIMWMLCHRFESDTLDVRWLTDAVAEMQFVVRAIYATDDPSFEALDCPVTGGEFSPGMEPVLVGGDLPVKAVPPYDEAKVVDLYDLGITQGDIDAGKIFAAAKWAGHVQAGDPLADTSRWCYLGIRFHATLPVTWDDPQTGPAQTFTGSQVGALNVALGSAVIPSGTRYVQFLGGYIDNASDTFTLFDDQTLWAIGRGVDVGG